MNRDLIRNIATVAPSRKQECKVEYARTQDLWRKNRSKCLRMLLDDTTGVHVPPKEVMVPFWQTVMTSSTSTSPGNDASIPTIDNLWIPIIAPEVFAGQYYVR
ncbi:reverse transcriptase [Lasius niger]|uniref:Reverse transcriptase n=1 Tax=Lasius niger TaxID=67767 RepID=A0A0J7JY95_LASNI|nr:reverse transcriptase [Lasius niger]